MPAAAGREVRSGGSIGGDELALDVPVLFEGSRWPATVVATRPVAQYASLDRHPGDRTGASGPKPRMPANTARSGNRGSSLWDTRTMSREEIDAYLAELDEPKRSTLESLRRSILEVVPHAQEGLAYRMPAFKVQGKTVAGFAAFKDHLSYLPHSGSVLAELGDEVAGYETSKGVVEVRRPPAAAEAPGEEADHDAHERARSGALRLRRRSERVSARNCELKRQVSAVSGHTSRNGRSRLANLATTSASSGPRSSWRK